MRAEVALGETVERARLLQLFPHRPRPQINPFPAGPEAAEELLGPPRSAPDDKKDHVVQELALLG